MFHGLEASGTTSDPRHRQLSNGTCAVLGNCKTCNNGQPGYRGCAFPGDGEVHLRRRLWVPPVITPCPYPTPMAPAMLPLDHSHTDCHVWPNDMVFCTGRRNSHSYWRLQIQSYVRLHNARGATGVGYSLHCIAALNPLRGSVK